MTVNATPPLSDVQHRRRRPALGSSRSRSLSADQIALHLLNGTENLVTEGYTVTGVSNENGGIVTYPVLAGAPLASGTQVIVARHDGFRAARPAGESGALSPAHPRERIRPAGDANPAGRRDASRAVVTSIFEAPGPETSPRPLLPPPDPGAAIVWGPGGVLENSTFDVGEFDTALINAQSAAEIATGMAAQATDAAAVAVTATTGLSSVVEFTSVEKFRTTGLSDQPTVAAAVASCFSTG